MFIASPMNKIFVCFVHKKRENSLSVGHKTFCFKFVLGERNRRGLYEDRKEFSWRIFILFVCNLFTSEWINYYLNEFFFLLFFDLFCFMDSKEWKRNFFTGLFYDCAIMYMSWDDLRIFFIVALLGWVNYYRDQDKQIILFLVLVHLKKLNFFFDWSRIFWEFLKLSQDFNLN